MISYTENNLNKLLSKSSLTLLDFMEELVNATYDAISINKYYGDSIDIIGDGSNNVGSHKLQSIVLDNTTLGNSTFRNCRNLTSVSGTIASIGKSAFRNCISLQTLSLLPALCIPDSCFANCLSLQSVDISKVTDYIGKSAFSLCTNINNIYIPEGVTTIKEYAFYRVGFTHGNLTITLPNTLTTIEQYGLYGIGCNSLALPESLRTLGKFALGFIRNTSIEIPNGVTSLPTSLFEGSYNLNVVTLPSSIIEIKSYTFANCPSLTKIIFKGTKTLWNSITKENSWYVGGWLSTPLSTIQCSDGNITINPHNVSNPWWHAAEMVEVPSCGWITFCGNFGIWGSEWWPKKVKGIYSASINNNSLTLTKMNIEASEKAGTPYLINASPGWYCISGRYLEGQSINVNGILKAVQSPTIINKGYVLQDLGQYAHFYRAYPLVQIPKGKAYLDIDFIDNPNTPEDPVIPDIDLQNKIISVIGNSFTYLANSADATWPGNWGAAASSEDKDYIHLLRARLNNNNIIAIGTNFGGYDNLETSIRAEDNISDLTILKYTEHYAEHSLDHNSDIVIIRLGENITHQQNTGTVVYSKIKNNYKRLLSYIKNTCSKVQRIICTNLIWYSAELSPIVNSAIYDAVQESQNTITGVSIEYWDMSELDYNNGGYVAAFRASSSGETLINLTDGSTHTVTGVMAAHPGNTGMLMIADSLYQCLTKGNTPSTQIDYGAEYGNNHIERGWVKILKEDNTILFDSTQNSTLKKLGYLLRDSPNEFLLSYNQGTPPSDITQHDNNSYGRTGYYHLIDISAYNDGTYQLLVSNDTKHYRVFSDPHHTAEIGFLNSQDTVYLQNGALKVNTNYNGYLLDVNTGKYTSNVVNCDFSLDNHTDNDKYAKDTHTITDSNFVYTNNSESTNKLITGPSGTINIPLNTKYLYVEYYVWNNHHRKDSYPYWSEITFTIKKNPLSTTYYYGTANSLTVPTSTTGMSTTNEKTINITSTEDNPVNLAYVVIPKDATINWQLSVFGTLTSRTFVRLSFNDTMDICYYMNKYSDVYFNEIITIS